MHMTGDGILGPRDTELELNPLSPDYKLVGPMVGKAEEARFHPIRFASGPAFLSAWVYVTQHITD